MAAKKKAAKATKRTKSVGKSNKAFNHLMQQLQLAMGQAVAQPVAAASPSSTSNTDAGRFLAKLAAKQKKTAKARIPAKSVARKQVKRRGQPVVTHEDVSFFRNRRDALLAMPKLSRAEKQELADCIEALSVVRKAYRQSLRDAV